MKFQKKEQIKVKLLTLEEVLNVVFLLIPYLKTIGKLKSYYNTENSEMFYELVKNVLEQVKKDDLFNIVKILTDLDDDAVKKLRTVDFIGIFIATIKENDLIACYRILVEMGVFE